MITKRFAFGLLFAAGLLIAFAYIAQYGYVKFASGHHAWYAIWSTSSRWGRSNTNTIAGPFSSSRACYEWINKNTDGSVAYGCQPRLH